MRPGDFTERLQVREKARQDSIYSPRLRRFVQADTIVPNLSSPQSLNRFMYVYGNPLNMNDPSGHDGKCLRYMDNQCVAYQTNAGTTTAQAPSSPTTPATQAQTEQNLEDQLKTEVCNGSGPQLDICDEEPDDKPMAVNCALHTRLPQCRREKSLCEAQPWHTGCESEPITNPLTFCPDWGCTIPPYIPPPYALPPDVRPPDYLNVTYTAIGPGVGWGFSLIMDEFGNVYFGTGPAFGIPGGGVSITDGWLTGGSPDEERLESYLTGPYSDLSGGYVAGWGIEGTPPYTNIGSSSFEVGFYTPGASYSIGYAWQIWDP
ncbi:MAG: hypothetical protein HYZ26_07690 [Chloroflexi bacterium]|nr:hypothetical protein [Chloroflexota bacterium]